MEVLIEKVYPIAYIEFIEDTDGKKRREGPRHVKEERNVEEKWKVWR
jgi:breast cancer 2 susceptibility protein